MKKTAEKAYLDLQDAIRESEQPPACAEPGLDYLFFPEPLNPTGIGRYSERNRDDMKLHEMQAKALCSLCPLKMLCADYALAGKEEHGIWGGTTPNERKEIWGLKKAKSQYLF